MASSLNGERSPALSPAQRMLLTTFDSLLEKTETLAAKAGDEDPLTTALEGGNSSTARERRHGEEERAAQLDRQDGGESAALAITTAATAATARSVRSRDTTLTSAFVRRQEVINSRVLRLA